MTGFRTPDGTVFLADCVSGRNALEKYAVPFMYDVGAYLENLDLVEGMEASMFIPAHTEATPDIRELVWYNRAHVQRIEERILELCGEPIHFEKLLQKVFQGYGLA